MEILAGNGIQNILAITVTVCPLMKIKQSKISSKILEQQG